MLNLLWQICYTTGLILIVPTGQLLKHKLTIWSHCIPLRYLLACFQQTITRFIKFIFKYLSSVSSSTLGKRVLTAGFEACWGQGQMLTTWRGVLDVLTSFAFIVTTLSLFSPTSFSSIARKVRKVVPNLFNLSGSGTVYEAASV